MKKSASKERESLLKLFETSYLIAKKGRPFTYFHDFLELEKLPGVKFDILCDNKTMYAEFVRYIK